MQRLTINDFECGDFHFKIAAVEEAVAINKIRVGFVDLRSGESYWINLSHDGFEHFVKAIYPNPSKLDNLKKLEGIHCPLKVGDGQVISYPGLAHAEVNVEAATSTPELNPINIEATMAIGSHDTIALEVGPDIELIFQGLSEAIKLAHGNSERAGWWKDPKTGHELLDNETYAPYVIATKLALIHSEVSEGLEGFRVDKMDDKLPERSMLEVELVDVIVRAFDLAGKLGLDLPGAFLQKCNVNTTRLDHALETRAKPGGKKF